MSTAVPAQSPPGPRQAGRYEIHEELANGGMAVVYLGKLSAGAGFSRPVAIKRLLPQYAKDPDFSKMFVDEARMASRVSHFNVVPTLDVIEENGELLLVMEYVHGETLSRLLRQHAVEQRRIPLGIALALVSGTLRGLHAAHEAVGKDGRPMGLVHRDVSPQNIIVGVDGQARVFDFGVAKATGRLHQTEDGKIKGKMSYMAPEQLRGKHLDRRADIYAAAVVLWELLTGRRLFLSEDGSTDLERVLRADVEPPTKFEPTVPALVEAIVMKALKPDREDRYATAQEMAQALDELPHIATATEVAKWLRESAGEALEVRSGLVAKIERMPPGEFTEGGGIKLPALERVLPTERTSQISALSIAKLRERRTLKPLLWAGAALVLVVVAFAFLRSPTTTHVGSETVRGDKTPDVSDESATPSEPPIAFHDLEKEPPGVEENDDGQGDESDAKGEPTSEDPSKTTTGQRGVSSSRTPPRKQGRKKEAAPSPEEEPAVEEPGPCNPPFTYNEQGHKVYKRECF